MRDIGTVLVLLSTLGSWVFCVLYSVLRWWTTPGGRHVFSFSAVIGAVLTLWSIGLITEASHSGWFDILRLVAFSGVPIVIWWRVWLLVKTNWSVWRRARNGGRR